MPLLRSFSQIDLSTLQSEEDDVFFQIPYWTTIKYPFAWSLTLSLLNLLIFGVVIGIGLKKKSINIKSIMCGAVPLFSSLLSTGLCSFLILTFLYWLHPQYSEILQGFTYNGHAYILFFSMLAINFCFFCYRSALKKHSASNLIVMPTLLWIIISIAAALLLTGAHFFILFSVAGTLILLHSVMSDKPSTLVTVLLFSIIIMIFFSFTLLPVALGMQLLPFSGLLLVLMLSVFISCLLVPEKTPINTWLLLAPLFCSFVYAQMGASTNQDRPLPNSLYYFQDQDGNGAFWMNNDKHTDVWNETFFAQDRLTPDELIDFHQTQWPWVKTVSKTENRQLPAAKIEIVIDQQLADIGICNYKSPLKGQSMY
ncbi:MAG: hypothetical protein JKY14_01280 [Paraglaciecola sp.]|nr:hypothetical protein [Paraglaciecola sp.]